MGISADQPMFAGMVGADEQWQAIKRRSAMEEKNSTTEIIAN